MQQQQHVSRWLAKKENSGNIKFYESFTQIATLLPINASPARSKVVATSAPSCHCLAVRPSLLSPLLQLFFVPFRLQFLYCCKMFSFQRSYIYFAHTQKKLFVALLTDHPHLPSPPFFIPSPALQQATLLKCCPAQPLPLFVAALSPLLSIRCCLYFLQLNVCVCACVSVCVSMFGMRCLLVWQNNGFLCTFYLAGNGCKRKVIGKIRKNCRKSCCWRNINNKSAATPISGK